MMLTETFISLQHLFHCILRFGCLSKFLDILMLLSDLSDTTESWEAKL